MSQIEVSIRPPPRRTNFVSGYPGIPPCAARPQATIKGDIELKIPPEGVRAKWVRVELHRIERLPRSVGGSRRFDDCVGPGPVTLWSSAEDYTMLTTQRFPFSIRIPESSPPTLNMEDDAGVGYQIEASVCVAVKARFLPVSKPVIIKSTSPITIDKHELHSIWPVYLQPEMRTTTVKGITLSVERTRKCHGPGDRISVTASIKSDNDATAVLQEFEISLMEVTTFIPGHGSPSKRSENTISTGEAALNATLCRGVSYSAELSCLLCSTHATTTLYSARHIDVSHTLSVKATLDNGTHLNIDLPVVISNWQQDVSSAALKRIGPIPRLSLLPTASEKRSLDRKDTKVTRSASAATKITPNRHKPTKSSLKNTDNSSSSAHSTVVTVTHDQNHRAAPPSESSSHATGNSSSKPESSNNSSTGAPSQDLQPSRRASKTWSKWPTVEQEKRLYEQARMRVVDVQGPEHAPAPVHKPKPLPSAPVPQRSTASLTSEYASASTSTTSHTQELPFVSAKDEKELMQKAFDATGEKKERLGGVNEEDGPPPPEYFKLFPETQAQAGYLSDDKSIPLS